jgi:hypothetical protein
LSQFDIVIPTKIVREFGDAAPDGGSREEYMAALTLRSRSLEGAYAALVAGRVNGVRREPDRIVVPADEAFGVTLEFRA